MKSNAPWVLIMGVTGVGKTTVGTLVAKSLGYQFLEGDAFHSKENRAKLEAGVPLTDNDRWPWLEAIANEVIQLKERGISTVVACSALKQRYREFLRKRCGPCSIVFLRGDEALIRQRLDTRSEHFANPAILRSQIDTLEAPEGAITFSISSPPEVIAEATFRILREHSTT